VNFDPSTSHPAPGGSSSPGPTDHGASGPAARDDRTHESRKVPAQPAGALRRRLDELQEELSSAFYRLYAERQELTGLSGDPRPATLELSLELSPDGGADGSADQLYRQVRDAAARLADRSAAFPWGHVYCYWCRSFTCGHSTPPEPRSVFSEYSPTGQPLWRELSSLLLERGDPRIEDIFRNEGGAPISLVQSGHELAARQLAVYGKSSSIYRILGQISLGYLVHPRATNGDRAPFAVTFQAIAGYGDSAAAQLNVLGVLPDGSAAAQALDEHFDPRITDAISTTRRRLADIALTTVARRRRARERSRRTLAALHLLAKNLDRIFRQGQRRTRHSQDRHRNRGRPASVALRDALNAGRGSVYRDVEEKTWVIIGPKNRVHVFNDRAMHVTSIVYPGETVRQRTTRGKWISPREEEVRDFLDALHVRAQSE